ncbi:MAG: DUF6323 family protein [Clostridia bacterium]
MTKEILSLTSSFPDFCKDLEECNQITVRYGIELTEIQMKQLFEERAEALKHCGRMEFGENPVKKLILAFSSSPYLTGEHPEETIAELLSAFYEWKNITRERVGDDELIEIMVDFFNGEAEGSITKMLDLTEDEIMEYGVRKEI